MPTIDELRAVLADRAAKVPASPPPTRAAIQAGRQRTHRRIVGGAAVLVTGAAVAVAAVWGAGGADVSLPQDPPPADRVSSAPDAEAWTPELPGFDLPLGADLTVPYTRNGVLVVDGHEVDVPDGFAAAESEIPLLTVPAGVVMLSDAVEYPTFDMYAQLELVSPNGAVTTLDSGVIAGAAAARRADGTVVVAYGWLSSPTAADGEVRLVEPGSGMDPVRIPLDYPWAVLAPRAGAAAPVDRQVHLGALVSGEHAGIALLDVDAGLIPITDSPHSAYLLKSAGGLKLVNDDDNCISATTPEGATAWQTCDAGNSSINLAPDRRTFVTDTGAYDADTGALLASFTDLPVAEGLSYVSWGWRPIGWESTSSVVVGYSVEQSPGADSDSTSETAYREVAVRCSTTTGECDRIPHPVDRLGTYAR